METELDFRVLFEATPGLVLALRPDPPIFTIIAATKGYLQATGMRSNDIIGLDLFDIFPGFSDEARNSAAGDLRRSLERVMLNRNADVMGIHKYQICPLGLGGEGWEERYWRGINSPVLGPTGKVEYILHRAQDMTEFVRLKEREAEHEQLKRELQLRAEKAEAEQLARERKIQRLNRHLRRALIRQQRSRTGAYLSNDWLEHLLLEVHEQVFALDTKWRYVYVNERVTQVVGLTKEQMLGKTIWELFPELVGSVFEHQIRQAAAEFSPVHFEYCYPPWKRWFEMHVYPSAERLTFFVAEITDRKKAEAALQESEERLAGELVTMNRLHELTLRLFGAIDLRQAMAEVLQAVTALMGTSMGDIRIYDSGRDALDVVAQSGFGAEFIEQYQKVSSGHAATCARAIKSHHRVVIDDIETDGLSELERRIAAAGRYRAAQSTPLLSRAGNLLGVLST
jgi:PAS domain S-box-containing protein